MTSGCTAEPAPAPEPEPEPDPAHHPEPDPNPNPNAGDRWLHRACRMAKRMRGNLFHFLYSQLAGDAALASGPASQHTALIRDQAVPPRL